MKTTNSKQYASVSLTRLSLVAIGLFLAATSSAVAQPVITTQPVNQFVNVSGSATFSVGVSGTGPFGYQWLSNGIPMNGRNSSSLPLSNLQPPSSGWYSVIITNASGSVTSQVAELKVFVAARHRLSGIQVEPGGSVSLSFAGETTASFAPYYDLYPLDASSNLVDWAPLATLRRSNTALNTLSFVDTNAPQFSQRFYRTPTNQLATPDPQPTGPYAVGTFSMLLTNVNRSNAKFMVTFWYPSVAQAGVLPAKYVEPQVAGGEIFYNLTSYGGGNFVSQVTAFFSHSLPNAPLAMNLSVYPVVLYDPGFMGHRRQNTDKVEELASWGYVVVGLDTSDTQVSVFPDGTVAYAQITSLSTIAQWDAEIESRLLDEQCVLDKLQSLNTSDPRLAGRLDLANIGSFGWSLGGATAAQLCLRDPRCKAGAGMDGTFWQTNVLTQPLRVPWLFFRSGDEPELGAGGMPDGRPDDRLEVYNEELTNAYYVKLISTDHGNFSDADLILDSASLKAGWGLPLSGQFLPPPRASQIERAYLLSFFNKYLKGEDDHLLDGLSPAYPEVLQFLAKCGAAVPPEYPTAALVQGSDGNFFGTTEYGGANNDGTIFQVTPAGVLTTLVSFSGTNGAAPYGALVQGTDGNFYGTTSAGGAKNYGTVFKMTPAGVLTKLASFSGSNGSYPYAGLVQGTDGNFYGTTAGGGASGAGMVFKMTPAGVLTTLYSFYSGAGEIPLSALVQGTNGSFYGTASAGGAYGYGTVFKITPAGAFTQLLSFNSGTGSYYPFAGLVQGSDGNFYGTTEFGGAKNAGMVFKMTPAGALTSLAGFNVSNGYISSAGLVQGSDGNFYGTTDGGGAGGGGTVFKMTPAGGLTTLVSFNGTNGINPQGGLVLGIDGNFYGVTEYGGTNRLGTVFQVTTNGTLTTLVSF
jgi:uncharacterized repeat protein (TIGR03803 family)